MKYNNDSDTDNDSEYNNDLFNSDDDTATTDDDDFFKKGMNKGTDEGTNCDSSYSSNRINVIMMKDTHNCQLINVNETKQPVRPNCNMDKVDEFGKMI